MELTQTAHHLWKGKYLAYTTPKIHGRGRAMMVLAPFDRPLARLFFRWLG